MNLFSALNITGTVLCTVQSGVEGELQCAAHCIGGPGGAPRLHCTDYCIVQYSKAVQCIALCREAV